MKAKTNSFFKADNKNLMKKAQMKKILLITLIVNLFLISGCSLNKNKKDVIKVTSEKTNSVSIDTGIKMLEAGNADGAVKFFEEYEDIFSKDPSYYQYLGNAYYTLGSYKKAAVLYEKSKKMGNNSNQLILDLAYAYLNAKNKTKAVKNFVSYASKNNDGDKIRKIRTELNSLLETTIGSNIIGRISLSDNANIAKNTISDSMRVFEPDTPIIFLSVEVINPEKNDKITINCDFVTRKGKNIPVNSTEFSAGESKTVLTSVKSPVTGWPPGIYSVTIYVNGEKNSTVKFYVF